jgi:spermidine synthase
MFDAGRDRLLLAALFLSGTAALGYEILWTRLLSLALGSETLGMLAVLTGFFGGLALGSWLLHERVCRDPSPARLFAFLEAVTALYAVASPHLLYALARHLPPLLGPAAGDNDTPLALALGVTVAGVALLPGTLPMGATLAALVEARRRALPGDPAGRGVGRLYAANTLGATLGVLAGVLLVLPRLGLGWGSVALAAHGLAAAALALLWARGRSAPAPAGTAPGAGRRRRAQPESAPGSQGAKAFAPGSINLLALVTFTGFAGIGLEVVAVQILAQMLEDTVYTFALALAAYLLGTAAGAGLYGRAAARLAARNHRAVTAWLLLAQTAAVAAAAVALRAAPALLALFAPPGSPFPRHLAAELALALTILLLPTAVMGALFSHLLAPLARAGVGRAYALNTLGGAAGPFVFGLGLLRATGYAAALAAVAVVYLALAAWAISGLRRAAALRWAGAMTLAAALVAFPRSLRLVEVPPGWVVRYEDAGLMGLVLVTEEESTSLPGRRLNRRLQVNQQFRMGGSLSFGERRMGHIPLLLAPGARNALFLGIGTGATLGAVRHFPLERVDAVELVPEVVRAMPLFATVNEKVLDEPRVRFHAADARRFVNAAGGRWDVIVGDLFHPAQDGAGSLYAQEHFAAVAARLAPGGIYAQWLPLYQFDPPNLRTVVRTFLDVFPEVHSVLGLYNADTPALALIGRLGPAPGGDRWPIPLADLERRLAAPVYAELLMQDPRDLLASYMLDRAALAAFAGDGPRNTDLRPRVLFDAPRIAYEKPPDRTWRCLAELLAWRVPYAPALVTGDAARLAAFRGDTARFSGAVTHYLEGDIARARGGVFSPAAVRGYLRAYEAAPEFQPAVQVLYSLAAADPGLAQEILPRMLRRDPADPRARELFAQLRAYLD